MSASLKVIIAEDDFVIRMFLQEVLEEAGFEVLALVHRAEDLHKQVTQQAPDFILMDIGLSGEVNGIEAALNMRENFNLPTVFMTGNSDRLRMDPRIARIQPLGTLIKPLDDRQIVKALKAVFPGVLPP